MSSIVLRRVSAACFAVAAILFAILGTWWAAMLCGVVAIVMAVLSRSPRP